MKPTQEITPLIPHDNPVYIATEMLFDTYLCALALTHQITIEQLMSHRLNQGIVSILMIDYDAEHPARQIVYPRFTNSRKAVELIKAFTELELILNVSEDSVYVG